MSQTLRLFVNDKRISTAVLTKKGSFLQVYPEKKTFDSEEKWRLSWKSVCFPEVRVETKEAAPSAEPPKKSSSKPSFNPKDWSYKHHLTFTAPPGKYYIGDICYVLDDLVYDRIFGDVGGYDGGIYTNNKTNEWFMVDGTAWGDGLFRANDYKEFGVDAGVIGIVPFSMCNKGTSGGHVYTFKEPVTCRFGAGVFRFTYGYNELIINTGGDDDEEY